ncbi:MAG: hypothetical protein DMG21_12685 [Acidobacteria bacterium]|nr:MAG: hypothetical protein DMG21_12685 [Acidobacteriota bacterium]
MRKGDWGLMLFPVLTALGLFTYVITDTRGVDMFGDGLDRRSRNLASRNAVDCGKVRVGGDPTASTKCALEMQARGKPFRVRYDILGMDYPMASGLVRTPEGQVYVLSFVGGTTVEGGTSFWHQTVSQTACPQPTNLWVNPAGRVDCFSNSLVPPHDIMSPNPEPH